MSAWARSTSTIALATFPRPTRPTLMTWLESKKAEWTARRDLVESEPLTTAEMILSEDPCEMASTLTPALPRALKNFPAAPLVLLMPSPTAAMMEQGRMMSTLFMRWDLNSRKNSSVTALAAASASHWRVAKEMEYSELAWAMRDTEMPVCWMAPKSRLAMPGTPIIPEPSRFRGAMLSTGEKPQTRLSRSMVEAEET